MLLFLSKAGESWTQLNIPGQKITPQFPNNFPLKEYNKKKKIIMIIIMSIIAFILCKIKEFPESQKKKNDLVN